MFTIQIESRKKRHHIKYTTYPLFLLCVKMTSQVMTQQESNRQSISLNVVKRVHREVRFGAYILGSTLGEGEFGKVKLGWRKDGKHPSQVAIKLIKRDSILKDSESEIKIHREINLLKLLSHPNIVNLVEVMKSGKYIGIVLEYASGGELFDYILHHKYLKENVAKKLFAQLISGVDYMHSKGLIHRDLKLENLLLDKHKNIIISDFGFVNSYNRDKNDLMKTSCGSPCYAAPELVLTQTPYEGRKVDIWSLGVILYAMLSGYLPFDDDPENEDGSDIVRLYHYICRTPLTFPEYVSPLARDLLRKIIVPDPKKRININEIRHHPWLAPHAQFLSMRQPEWDKVTTKEVEMPSKRFSMVNERTNSSSLMDSKVNQHSRSYSSTSISQLYSSPSISSLLANAVSRGENSGSDSPSPTKYVRGHTKSALASYTASTVLKAMVDDTKRNSLSSVEFPTKGHNFPIAPIQRSTIYAGTPIGTIAESPAKKQVQTPLSRPAYGSPTSRDNRLPHAKKPRPTSYHPLSMTSSLMGSDFVRPNMPSLTIPAKLNVSPLPSPVNISPSSSDIPSPVVSVPIPYLGKSPANSPIPLYLSTSPSKSSPISQTTERSVERDERNTEFTENIERLEKSEGNVVLENSPVLSQPLPQMTSRRNSVVTHVHVNGVFNDSAQNSPENPARVNSVLSYLEDKMDGLDLSDSPQKTKSTSILPSSSVVKDTFDQKIPKLPVKEKSKPKRRPNSMHVRGELVSNKENIIAKADKKRNRFSLLSLYSSYNETPTKKVLEPSQDVNLAHPFVKPSSTSSHQSSNISLPPPVVAKEKRVHSGTSSSLKKSTASNSTAASSANGKEASAARKVMDFFKRRSVRV